MEGVRNVRFQQKTGHISEKVIDRASWPRLLLITGIGSRIWVCWCNIAYNIMICTTSQSRLFP